ncbi:PAS domain S-box protein [Solidesulfovibrio carbinolicus]|uniref:histidine kinase n=1 Tax=Solidesulfovibrio carbinolicus TaxID=296842 RepID=A0A4P6HMM2_9BACT|nr:PAS domain S-box protein [Solidesulfovibrio carbinolicus]QAZ67874.1 histidine kinase [Solidesulfovibrio carbinolicus]
MPIPEPTSRLSRWLGPMPIRVALLYALFGLVWILGSDNLADALFRHDPDILLRVSSLKGFFFVGLTSVLLYTLLRRYDDAYRHKEQELRDSEERHRLVVEYAPDAILIHDGVRFLYANPEAAKLFGAPSPQAIEGREIMDFVDGEVQTSVRERIRQNIIERVPALLREQRYRRLDGGMIEAEVAAVPFDINGGPGALVFMRDVGPRKAAERSLRRSERQYRLLADNAHDLINIFDENLDLTYVSPSVTRLLGFSVAEALARPLDVGLTPDSVRRVAEIIRLDPTKSVDSNFVRKLEIEAYRRDGSTVWLESMIRGVFDQSGAFRGYIAVSRDISDRKRAETELELSRQFSTLILEAIPDPVFVKDSAHRFVLANEALCAMLGQPAEALIGKSDEDFVPMEQAAVFVERDNIVLETGQPDLYEEYLTDATGQVRTLLTRKGLFIDHRGQRFIVGVIRDMTAERIRERELRDSLAEKEVLLKEVHHRVKNNLQIISSLLFLQKDAMSDPVLQGALEESRNRIASMALIHEELYRSGDLARVDIKEYLERLAPKVVHALRGAKSVGFALSLADCRVSVDKAIPIGLIVNELLTNAVKHGLASRDTGAIGVRLERDGGLAHITVEDDGAGLPSGFHPDATRTLGMQLVVQLTRQLRGTLSFGSSGEGAFFRLSFAPEDSPA